MAYGRISGLKVMRSAAGFYVGRSQEMFGDRGEFVANIPYSRESAYYGTYEGASVCLDTSLIAMSFAPLTSTVTL